MYTVGKGPITVKDVQKSVAEKIAQRRPKKQVQVDTQFTLTVDDDDDDGFDNEDIDPELRGIVFGDNGIFLRHKMITLNFKHRINIYFN
jgi:hypothetical protein